MTLSWARANAKEWLPLWKSVVSHNMALLSRIIEWNESKGIKIFRISSDLVPFADHPQFGRPWRRLRLAEYGWWSRTINPARTSISAALARGSRFTMHPAQFVSLGASRARVRRSSVSNLKYHAALMDDLVLPRSLESPINIHVGNGRRASEATPWVKMSLSSLSPGVLLRLVFENEQSGHWTPSALMESFPGVPVTLDYHHLLLNPDPVLTLGEIESRIQARWGPIRPVCHWSEGRTHQMDPAHSEYVKTIPRTCFDLEIEAKGKDLAVLEALRTASRLDQVQ